MYSGLQILDLLSDQLGHMEKPDMLRLDLTDPPKSR